MNFVANAVTNARPLLRGVVVAVALLLVCCTPEARSPDVDVEEAAALIVAAAEAESRSFGTALQIYREAEAALDRMVADFPKSQQAAEFAAGTLRVGPFRSAQLKAHREEIRGRAVAESDPILCTAFVVERIVDLAARVEFSARLAELWLQQGQEAAARAVLVDADALAAGIADDYDRSMARVALARGWGYLGDEKEADRQIADIGDRRLAGSEPGLAHVLAYLAVHEVLASAAPSSDAQQRQAWMRRMLQEAHDLVAVMDTSTRDRPWALAALAAAYARIDRGVEATRQLSLIADPADRVSAAVSVAGAWRSRGDDGAADYWLEQALEEAGAIEDPYRLAMALSETAGGYIDAGASKRARDLLDQSLSIARKIDELSPSRAGALTKLARKYAALGDEDEAMMIAEVMLDRGELDASWARAGIARSLASAGRFRRSVPVVFSIPRRAIRRQTLAAVLLEEAARSEVERTSDAFTLHRILTEFG